MFDYIEKHLTPVERLDIGTHGFPLPDIRTWNFIVNTLLKDHPKEQFRGFVDDLADDKCPGCDGNLVRLNIDFDARQVFAVGIVYCPRSVETHPAYWFEVWPFAGEYNPRDRKNRKDNSALFGLSNPNIRRCFSESDVFYYRITHPMEWQSGRKSLPSSPSYTHPKP